MTKSSNSLSDLHLNVLTDDEIEWEVEEVRIKVPQGIIAAKFWGPKDVQPIICIHGWQDNAGTFDRLIPMLPKNLSFLAIDLPGHGFSYRQPFGVGYNTIDILLLLNVIMQEYKWSKISLIGHSMGAVMSFLFSSAFPDRVNFVIAIDALKPAYDPKGESRNLPSSVDNFLKDDYRNQGISEPPSYDYDELVERMIVGNRGSLTKETCPYLIRRNIKKSEKFPNKFYFTRDSRMKNSYLLDMEIEISKELAKRIKIPYLYIKASNSRFFKKVSDYDAVGDIMKSNPNFEMFVATGEHHVHLTHPENCAPGINEFLKKYYNRSKL